MFVPVRLSVDGEEVYARGFEMIQARANNLSVPLAQIGKRIVVDVGEQFASDGAWGGTPWAPLSEPYATWKEDHFPGRPLLVQTGEMRAHLLNYAQSVRVTAFSMLYEPDSDIAYFHQHGTEKMPARPEVSIGEVELHEWDRLFVRWVNGLLDEAGL